MPNTAEGSAHDFNDTEHAHIPAATNSSGVSTPFSRNWLTLETGITASTVSLNTVCTACFMLSNADIAPAGPLNAPMLQCLHEMRAPEKKPKGKHSL